MSNLAEQQNAVPETVKKESKQYFKITFQDIEIAEEFFENEKHLNEFLIATMNYYRGKESVIKTKIVKKYFETYKKTMNVIIKAREFGKKGAEKRAENQVVSPDTLEGVVKGSVLDPLSTKESNVIKEINKTLLSEIDRDSLNDLDRMYFDIAIGFRDRFILNKKRLGLTSFKDQENATYKNYVEPIRLAFEKDKRTKDDFEKVFRFLTHDEFWMKNIMSTSTLKKQMDTLLLKLSNLKDKPVTKTFVKPITSKYSV